MKEQQKLKEHLYSLETTSLKEEVRKSADLLNELLADEFIEYSSTGAIFDKENVLNRLPIEADPGISLSDFQLKHLSPTAALTTFKIFVKSKAKYSSRSPVWKLNNMKWQMTFHQGTPTDE